MQKRNIFIGILASFALISGTALSASAATVVGDVPTTAGGGTLTLAAEEYSIDTVYVKATYSHIIFPGVTIDISAKDAATGKVVSTSHIDSDTWVYERVLDNFKLGHDYVIDATLAWKDGSQQAISAAPVRQHISFTDTLKTMTFKTINADVPLNELNGTVYHAQIRYGVQDDPRALGEPTTPKVKVAKRGSSRVVTWRPAKAGSGFALTNYKVVLSSNGKTIASKKVSLSSARRVAFKIKRNAYYSVEVRAVNLAGNYASGYKEIWG